EEYLGVLPAADLTDPGTKFLVEGCVGGCSRSRSRPRALTTVGHGEVGGEPGERGDTVIGALNRLDDAPICGAVAPGDRRVDDQPIGEDLRIDGHVGAVLH